MSDHRKVLYGLKPIMQIRSLDVRPVKPAIETKKSLAEQNILKSAHAIIRSEEEQVAAQVLLVALGELEAVDADLLHSLGANYKKFGIESHKLTGKDLAEHYVVRCQGIAAEIKVIYDVNMRSGITK